MRVVLVMSLCLSCAAPAPAPAPAPASAPASAPAPAPAPASAREDATPYARALARARAERDRAQGMLAPRYSGNGSKDSVEAFIKGPIARWAEAKREAVEGAERAYGEAFERAAWPERQVEVLAEAAPLWADYADEMRDTGPLPSEARNDAELQKLYLNQLDEALEPLRKKSADAAERCMAIVVEKHVDTPAARRCEVVRARLKPR